MNPYIIGGAALVMVSLLSWGLWERGEKIAARAERDLAIAQDQVLAAGLRACNAGVDQAKKVGEAAIAATGELAAVARRISAPAKVTVERIETIIEKPAPAGAGCDQAWDQIEAERKARAK